MEEILMHKKNNANDFQVNAYRKTQVMEARVVLLTLLSL